MVLFLSSMTYSHRLYYLLDYFNYLDFPALLFTFLIIPLRATGQNVQWLFASLCYVLHGLRTFKYAAVFRYMYINVCDIYPVRMRKGVK